MSQVILNSIGINSVLIGILNVNKILILHFRKFSELNIWKGKSVNVITTLMLFWMFTIQIEYNFNIFLRKVSFKEALRYMHVFAKCSAVFTARTEARSTESAYGSRIREILHF